MFSRNTKIQQEYDQRLDKVVGLVENTQKTQEKSEKIAEKLDGLYARMQHQMVDLEKKSKMVEQEQQKIEGVAQSFEKRLRSFDLLMGKIENKVFTKLNQNIADQLDMFRKEIKEYAQTKTQMQEVLELISQLKQEAAKVTEVTGQIKQGDYRLSKYAKELNSMEDQKLKLLMEKEKLQKLVGSLRRRLND